MKRWWTVVIVGTALTWAYFGFPSPDTLFRLSGAKDECVKFAEENRSRLFVNPGTIRALDQWMKNGKIVVELGAFEPNSNSYTPRLCVLGGGRVQIVSIFENNAWR
jgi:hypothetical protein